MVTRLRSKTSQEVNILNFINLVASLTLLHEQTFFNGFHLVFTEIKQRFLPKTPIVSIKTH